MSNNRVAGAVMDSVPYFLNKRMWPLLGRHLLIVYALSFIAHYSSSAQIGTWQTHVSYQSGQSVAVVNNKVYAATQNGFFSTTNRLRKPPRLVKRMG